MQLADGIWMVDHISAANVFILAAQNGAVIVDSGVRHSEAAILDTLRDAGFAPADVQLLLATHAHMDHIGSLPELQRATGAPIAASPGEAHAIEGHVPLPHPPGLHGLLLHGVSSLLRPQPLAVQYRLQPGASIPQLPGWHVVRTPGHTLDHISLYHPAQEWLIAGDAVAHFGAIRRSPWLFTSNMPLARASVALLAGLRLRNIAFGHGPAIIDDPSVMEQLAAVARADRS